ncbi:MAG: RNA-directed DNA polymerase [Prevotella sp.]|nr:RNA-directed DNA polymerase [Prevotella sp.]
MGYTLTYEDLLADLHTAYLDARRHKRQKPYQRRFEAHAEENLRRLCDELWERSYLPGPSTCFIITDPKKREVFAAQFRDRIVHHLYYNYVHEMLERTFIQDTYSCLKQRGTHYGISRLERHIRRESQNYTRRCYVLKMDIRGYFMHINRQRLFDITMRQLRRMARHQVGKGQQELWAERVDMDFMEYLTRKIVMQDATVGCCRRGTLLDWYGLPKSKSLFCSDEGCGLPIGNLTSQLFSNVYLNEFDQFMKRQMLCHRYGRYVDDFYVVSTDRKWLLGLQYPISDFLKTHLGLTVNDDKTMICDVLHGVEFLGAFLKPRRRYVSNASLHRMRAKVPSLEKEVSGERLRNRLNSFLGILSHYRSYKIRRSLFYALPHVYHYGYYLRGMTKYKILTM